MRRFLGKKASFRVLITPSLNSPKESFLLTCFFFLGMEDPQRGRPPRPRRLGGKPKQPSRRRDKKPAKRRGLKKKPLRKRGRKSVKQCRRRTGRQPWG